MIIYTIVSNYFENGLYGSYSTVKKARQAFESRAKESTDIVSCEDIGDYRYSLITDSGKCFWAEIMIDELDFEFNNGLLTDD